MPRQYFDIPPSRQLSNSERVHLEIKRQADKDFAYQPRVKDFLCELCTRTQALEDTTGDIKACAKTCVRPCSCTHGKVRS